MFCFLFVSLLVCVRAFFPYLLVELSFVVLECPVWSVLFDPIDIFLVFYLSSVPSDLFPRVVLF